MKVIISISSQLWRKPHDLEIKDYDSGDWTYGGDGYRLGKVRAASQDKGMPEVYRLDPEHSTLLNCGWQMLWRLMNPQLSDQTWSSLLGNSLAWTNGTGFPGRYNCITGSDSDEKFPAYHIPILNGGAVVKGHVHDGLLWMENLLNTDPIPQVSYVLERQWLWYWGTTVIPSGRVNYITRKGVDGLMYPVRVPFITSQPVYIPVSYMHKLPIGSPIPDARWMA